MPESEKQSTYPSWDIVLESLTDETDKREGSSAIIYDDARDYRGQGFDDFRQSYPRIQFRKSHLSRDWNKDWNKVTSLHFNLLNCNVFSPFHAFAPKARTFCLACFVSTRERSPGSVSLSPSFSFSPPHRRADAVGYDERNISEWVFVCEVRREWRKKRVKISRASNGRADKKASHNSTMNVPSR